MEFPRVVYALKHEPTGKIYVGSTHDVINRVRTHISLLKRGYHTNVAMQEDFNRYGEGYVVFVLDGIQGWSDRNKEYLWMDALKARDPERGYNGKEKARATALTGIKGIWYPMDACESRTLAEKALVEKQKEVFET